MLQPVGVGHKTLADYTHLVGRPLIEEINELAITEASNWLMGGERRQLSRDEGGHGGRLEFKFDLKDDSLELCVGGEEMPTVSAEERELSLALIKATVDDYEYGDGLMRLTKRLDFGSEQ